MGRGRGSAPGRLDFLGGVSDYSGALVLEAAIQLETRVTIEGRKEEEGQDGNNELVVEVESVQFPGTEAVVLGLRDLEAKARESLERVRLHLSSRGAPKWSSYVLGTLSSFCRYLGRFPTESIRVVVDSDVPHGQGVSSSASVEVAVVRALRDYFEVEEEESLDLARLAQRAENEVVGAPCGIMDQVACLFGTHGAVLPINCASVSLSDLVYLPDDIVLVGFPTRVQHDLAGEYTPYERARTATAMAAKIAQTCPNSPEIRSLSDIGCLSLSKFEACVKPLLPKTLSGSAFLAKYEGVGEIDALSRVKPDEEYPVLDAMEFAVQASLFAGIALSLLESNAFSEKAVQDKALAQVGELMLLQHQSYNKIGLGHVLTDSIIDLLMSFGPGNGIYGARSSGGGSGGTICILCNEAALPIIENIAKEYKIELIL
ncbi:mevalonate/galactokinase [Chloropicon primus]|uniref:Mevalonate/galactokinase n=1 Tax=Chloropicon primus TaxID=1764295 RepID=A0A5B8MQD3_9CHLO|nr:mevalonate/galactokinase [Chloropicon primus]UPR00723.1 mevalonate/galactokinase [Chloropicon primus]|eukprot:QDZ21512.1 mevalonate/galactokinase [Chloropicon primus]